MVALTALDVLGMPSLHRYGSGVKHRKEISCAPLLIQQDNHPIVAAALRDLTDKLISRDAAHRAKLWPLCSLLELLQPLLPACTSSVDASLMRWGGHSKY